MGGEDETLIDAGDAFWTEVRGAAYRALRGAGVAHADADDAAQETMIELSEAVRSGEPLRNPAGWAAVVARRRASDLMREDRVRRGLPARRSESEIEADEDARLDAAVPSEREVQPEPDHDSPSSASSREPGRGISARRSVERFVLEGMSTSLQAIRREQLDRLVGALDERSLQMVWLKMEGLPNEEIADALDMKVDALKKALQRMRRDIEQRALELGVDRNLDDHPRAY
jgi:RNA polymerase sigma factor (sigma-70 family)